MRQAEVHVRLAVPNREISGPAVAWVAVDGTACAGTAVAGFQS